MSVLTKRFKMFKMFKFSNLFPWTSFLPLLPSFERSSFRFFFVFSPFRFGPQPGLQSPGECDDLRHCRTTVERLARCVARRRSGLGRRAWHCCRLRWLYNLWFSHEALWRSVTSRDSNCVGSHDFLMKTFSWFCQCEKTKRHFSDHDNSQNCSDFSN